MRALDGKDPCLPFHLDRLVEQRTQFLEGRTCAGQQADLKILDGIQRQFAAPKPQMQKFQGALTLPPSGSPLGPLETAQQWLGFLDGQSFRAGKMQIPAVLARQDASQRYLNRGGLRRGHPEAGKESDPLPRRS
ncbi:hypothetical protein IV102_33960 [bacterium]|nr:hypothetical protein [bacterium]